MSRFGFLLGLDLEDIGLSSTTATASGVFFSSRATSEPEISPDSVSIFSSPADGDTDEVGSGTSAGVGSISEASISIDSSRLFDFVNPTLPSVEASEAGGFRLADSDSGSGGDDTLDLLGGL